MPIPFACTCGKRFTAKDEHAGKQSKCPACGALLTIPQLPSAPNEVRPVERDRDAVRTSPPPQAMRRPAPRPVESVERYDPRDQLDGPETGKHSLTAYPVSLVLLFNFLTIGIFGAIRMNLMHGRLPRTRPNDPSAGRAIGFLFIPCFNLYWFFFTFLRLAERLNEQRRLYGLPRAPLSGMALAFCIGHVAVGLLIAFVFPAGLYINPWSLIIGTLFFTVVQGAVNEIVELKALGVAPPETSKPCPRCAEWIRPEAEVCRYCGHKFPEGEAAAVRERDASEAEERVDLVRRVVLRNKRNLRQAWGWTLVGCGGSVLLLFLVGGIGAMVAPPPKDAPNDNKVKKSPAAEADHHTEESGPEDKPAAKQMDLGSFLIGMSCTIAMILVFFLLPGGYLLYRAKRLGQELALLESDPAWPPATR